MPDDPFREARRRDGILKCPFQGEDIPMLLRHADVRKAARDWETFSSDAPFRVPIPSEENLRPVRQLPIETDPPVHTAYRKLVEPFFKRPKDPDFVALVKDLISGMIKDALAKESLEIVSEFALPIQSRALTYLLNVPESEAEIYIRWGVHVFHDENGSGSQLTDYLNQALDRAAVEPGKDFFSALHQVRYEDRPLTRDEMMGFANLTFAGGRDTIIHTISSIIHYLGNHPEDLESLRQDPKRCVLASEEFFRAFMPLTHIGRVCPAATEINGQTVPPDGRVSLGWAAANFDEEVFEDPTTVDLNRKPNPHVSFGFGAHLCLGAAHARLIVRTLLETLVEQVDAIEIISSNPHLEENPAYQRENGFDSLMVRILPTLPPTENSDN
jgi:cytochrome P450